MSIEVHAYQNCQCDSFNFFWGELKFSLNLSSLPIEASFLFVLWLCHGACGILVPWPGIKPESSVAKAESLNHCTTREFPESRFLTYLFSCVCVYAHVRLVVSDSLWPHGLQPCQALSMEFPRQEYWSGLPFPPRGDLPDPGIQPVSPESPSLAGGFFTTELPGKPLFNFRNN